MPDRLFITSWDIEHWGRASGNRQEEISDGLTVVYGPNASGKSSVAMALAWLMAGPGFYADLNPFGTAGDSLHASLTAQLGDDEVHLGVEWRCPSRPTENCRKRRVSLAISVVQLSIETTSESDSAASPLISIVATTGLIP